MIHKYVLYVLLIGGVLGLAACNVRSGEFQMHDPVREAEATRVALAARDEAAQRALERQILAAQAEKAQVDAQASRNALAAITLRNVLINIGLGLSVLVLVVGSAFAAVAWLNKHATSIYPNSAGLYPVIVKRAWNGLTFVHDPNRALGSTTIYNVPGLSGLLPGQGVQAPDAQFPLGGGESSLLQLATQAQAVGLMAAATRHKTDDAGARQVGQLAEALINRPAISAPMPPVRPSSLEPSHVARLLVEAED